MEPALVQEAEPHTAEGLLGYGTSTSNACAPHQVCHHLPTSGSTRDSPEHKQTSPVYS